MKGKDVNISFIKRALMLKSYGIYIIVGNTFLDIKRLFPFVVVVIFVALHPFVAVNWRAIFANILLSCIRHYCLVVLNSLNLITHDVFILELFINFCFDKKKLKCNHFFENIQARQGDVVNDRRLLHLKRRLKEMRD